MGSGDEFEFVDGSTPLSEWWLAMVAPLFYLAAIHGLKKMVVARCGPSGFAGLTNLVAVHNFMLSGISAILFVDVLSEVVRIGHEAGTVSLFCDPEGRWVSKGRLYYLLYINYLLKYVELGDTVLLALRAKPMPVLHVYHHAATLVLCLTQLRGQTSLQWYVVLINLFVHVVMYAFYGLHTLKIDVWWKRYVTVLQIAQFVAVVVLCSIVYILNFVLCPLGIGDILQPYCHCHGELGAATFGLCILWSYLLLFIRLYRQIYKQKNLKHE